MKGNINFAVDENDGKITISGGPLILEFINESGFGLYSISNLNSGYNFLTEEENNAELWKIKLKNSFNEFLTIDNTIDCNRHYKIEHSQDGNITTLYLYWNGIAVGEEEDALNVETVIRIEDSGMSYWKIKVLNNSKQYGIKNQGYGVWEIIFPIVRGLKASNADSIYLAYPRYLGQLIKNPVERMPLRGVYPSYESKMQFSTLFKNDGENGIFLGTFDPETHQKKFLYDLDQKGLSLKWQVINYPEGMGQSTNGYNMPYEAVIGVYRGDWITATKLYRNWAVNQYWCSKGKLYERDEIPEWYQKTVLWFSGLPTKKMIPLAKYLDVPVAFHWYRWDKDPSVHAPDYFPPASEFLENVAQLQNADIKIVPYINSRIWDVNSESWNNENPYSASSKGLYTTLEGLTAQNWGKNINKDLMIYLDHWSGNSQAAMCPYTEMWQNKQSEIITRLVSEYNVDGVYMDQIASYYPMLCFDPEHQHTLGGGNYWVEGYRKMINLCYQNARKIEKETILVSEGHAETYLDLFDGNLACNSTSIAPELIPMFHYVYSGYCLTFGRMSGDHWHDWNGDIYSKGLPLIMRNAQMFVWGEQLGWFNPNVLDLPSDDAKYIKNLCQSMDDELVKKFLYYGEMIRPPILSGDNPTLSAKWRTNQNYTEMPAVLHSAWKAEDGSLGLVFTNMDSIPHEVSFSLNFKQYQLFDSKQYILKVLWGKGKGETMIYKSPMISLKEQIEARNNLIIEINSIIND